MSRILRALRIHCYDSGLGPLDIEVGVDRPAPSGVKPIGRSSWRDVRPDDRIAVNGTRRTVMTIVLLDYEPQLEPGFTPLVYSGADWLATGETFILGYGIPPQQWQAAVERNAAPK